VERFLQVGDARLTTWAPLTAPAQGSVLSGHFWHAESQDSAGWRPASRARPGFRQTGPATIGRT